jgi:hypothetical protein
LFNALHDTLLGRLPGLLPAQQRLQLSQRVRPVARLLLAHLTRLDRVEQRGNVYRVVREFDERVERLLEPPPVYHRWDDDYEDDCADEGED